MVFHDYGLILRVLLKLGGNLFTQQFAARQGVRSKAHGAANPTCLRNDRGVRHLVQDGKSDQSRRMRMDHRAQHGTLFVQRTVERIFRRGPMRAHNGTIGLHAHDIGRREGTFIDARGGNPHIPVVVHNGQVSAGSGCHLPAIDAADDKGDLLGRMHELRINFFHSNSADKFRLPRSKAHCGLCTGDPVHRKAVSPVSRNRQWP